MSINSSYSGRGASYNNNNYNNNSSSSATQRFLADASLVNRSIGQFSDAIRQIQRIQQSASNAASDSERKEYTRQLDQMIHEANQLGNQIRIDIKQIERSNQTTSADYQLRTSQKQNLVKKFMQSLTEYQSIQQSYQRQQQERARRQYLIVNPSATQAELTTVMDGAHSGPVFAQQLMASQQYGSAKRMMDDVQARHEEIVRLAQSIEQLQQLFLDMQTMVEMQDAHIMQVASHLNETAASTRNAAEEMQVAVKHKKTSIKRRRVMICCLIILLITVACVIMLMPGWPTNIIDAINRSKQPSSATK